MKKLILMALQELYRSKGFSVLNEPVDSDMFDTPSVVVAFESSTNNSQNAIKTEKVATYNVELRMSVGVVNYYEATLDYLDTLEETTPKHFNALPEAYQKLPITKIQASNTFLLKREPGVNVIVGGLRLEITYQTFRNDRSIT
jgi:hypothetical protein